MKHLYENDKIEIQNLKHSKRMAIVGMIFLTIILSTAMGMMFLKMVEEREKTTKQEETINKLNYENVNLQKEIYSKQNQINSLSNQNNDLRRMYNNYAQTRQQFIRPEQIKPKIKEETYTQRKSEIEEPKIYNQKNIYTAPKYQTPKYQAPKKMYQRYTVAKLVSDSRIEVMSDNRLKSNMPIYGRYINEYGIYTECGKNERIYKIQNECTGIVFAFEKIYYRKSNVNSIQNHNRNTHMIECNYDYENGIMQDCSVKLIGVR